MLWGLRVVVPAKLQKLQEIHEAHPGATRCKQFARSYVLWPGLDGNIEKFVGSSSECVEHRRDPDKEVPARWEYLLTRFQRLHIDFAGLLF